MSEKITAVTHTEKVIAGEVTPVTHLEKVIAEHSGGGGGFTPTDAQLAAMNSGITSEDVEQIGTNENNISSLLPTTFTVPSINPNVDITIIYGGYTKIGNLVVINMRFIANRTIAQGLEIFIGLPKAINMVDLSNGQAFVSMNALGVNGTTVPYFVGTRTDENNCSLAYGSSNSAALQVGTYVLSGMYLCENT